MLIEHFFALLIPILGIVFGCGLPIAIVGLLLYFKHRKEVLWHETARLALEKGQPIPARPDGEFSLADQPPPTADLAEWRRLQRASRRWRDLRAGLILVAIGAAFFFAHAGRIFGGTSEIMFPGYILVGLGVALLLNALLSALFSGKKPAPQA
jgi:Domain of unknown function (DUF6249)